LKIALDYFGIKKSEKELIKLCKCGKYGVDADSLLKVAVKLGLKGFIKDNSDFNDIRKNLKQKSVVIVDWFLDDDGHFGIVYDIDKENIYIQDPDLGHRRALRLDIFKRIWFTFPGAYMRTKNDLQLRRMIVLHK